MFRAFPLAPEPDAAAKTMLLQSVNLQLLRLLRLAKLVRAIRIMRTLRLFRGARSLAGEAKNSVVERVRFACT